MEGRDRDTRILTKRVWKRNCWSCWNRTIENRDFNITFKKKYLVEELMIKVLLPKLPDKKRKRKSDISKLLIRCYEEWIMSKLFKIDRSVSTHTSTLFSTMELTAKGTKIKVWTDSWNRSVNNVLSYSLASVTAAVSDLQGSPCPVIIHLLTVQHNI